MSRVQSTLLELSSSLLECAKWPGSTFTCKPTHTTPRGNQEMDAASAARERVAGALKPAAKRREEEEEVEQEKANRGMRKEAVQGTYG